MTDPKNFLPTTENILAGYILIPAWSGTSDPNDVRRFIRLADVDGLVEAGAYTITEARWRRNGELRIIAVARPLVGKEAVEPVWLDGKWYTKADDWPLFTADVWDSEWWEVVG